jgi:hypothetical protein
VISNETSNGKSVNVSPARELEPIWESTAEEAEEGKSLCSPGHEKWQRVGARQLGGIGLLG